MKTINELRESAYTCLYERKKKIESKQYLMDNNDLKQLDFIIVFLETGNAAYLYKDDEINEKDKYILFKIIQDYKTKEFKLKAQFTFRDIEGDREIFDEETSSLYEQCRNAFEETKRATKDFIVENFGIVDEEKTKENEVLFEWFGGTIKEYKNIVELEQLQSKLITSLGYSCHLGKYEENDHTDILITPFGTWEFIYLIDSGKDDLGDVCSNYCGVVFYSH